MPFTGPFADLPTQFLEASSRAISASAELYTQVLTAQGEATRSLLEAYSGLAGQTALTGAQTAEQATEKAAETTTRTARTTARATRSTARTAKRTTRRAAGATRRAAKPAAAAAAKPATEAAKAAAAATPPVEAPITGYDDLTAEELVTKLPEQPQAKLAQIAAYEAAKDNRATVLQRVAALTGPEPAPGYDELNAEDAQKLVTNGSAELAATVRDYERRHKDRASVVETASRHADAS